MYKPLKTPTTYSQQLSILQTRNVVITDALFCENTLSRINYYRLSGYLLPFYNKAMQKCSVPVAFERIFDIYTFDTELRNLLSLAIEKIEIYLRAQISYYCAHHIGAEGYMDACNFNSKHNHVVFLGHVNRCIQDNKKAPAINHHIRVYGGKFPIWVIIDYFSLGMLSHFYTDLKNCDKTSIAYSSYHVNYQTLSSWLRCLTDLRNRCAHYSRLYYWKFPAIPKMPKTVSYSADQSLFSQLLMLKMLYPNPEKWEAEFVIPLSKLMGKYKSSIDRKHLGFPYRWKSILLK